MYLTEEEFKVLSGKKIGLSNHEISKNMKISVTAVKVAYHNLLSKYEAKDIMELNRKANLKNVEVAENLPYYDYEKIEGHKRLVKKIKITKEEVLALAKFFGNTQENEFELISYCHSFCKSLYIKNQKTKDITEIHSEITD